MKAITRILTAAAVIITITTQAATLNFLPGQYGSYYANGTTVRSGNYSFRPQGSGNIWQDRTGNQVADLNTLSDGVYEIFARDAGVVIGTFQNTGGVPSYISGSYSLAPNGSDYDFTFINHDIAVSGAAGWTSTARIFNVAWGEIGVTKFVLPAGNGWDGWWTVINDSSFVVNVDSAGNVSVPNQSPGIGLAGGAGTLVFPDEIEPITVTLSGNPPSMTRWALDWVTGNTSTLLSTVDLLLYAGTYRFANDGDGSWVGGSSFTIPVDSIRWSQVMTWHDNTDGLDYTFTFANLVPEPSTGLLIGLGGLLALRRRR